MLFMEYTEHEVELITSAQIWDTDKKRIDILQNRGYNILIVWSSEYITDKISTVNKCLEFLRNN
jgi:G:T-mismatch repair DNA endonuclease (very short patch repair protein)